MLRGNRTVLYRPAIAWTVTSILNVRPAGTQSRTLSWRSCLRALTSSEAYSKPCGLVHCSWLSQGLCQNTITDRQHAVPGQCQPFTQHAFGTLAVSLYTCLRAAWVHTRLRLHSFATAEQDSEIVFICSWPSKSSSFARGRRPNRAHSVYSAGQAGHPQPSAGCSDIPAQPSPGDSPL